MKHGHPSTLTRLRVAALDSVAPAQRLEIATQVNRRLCPFTQPQTRLARFENHAAENAAEAVNLQRETGQRLTSNSHVFTPIHPDRQAAA
jgi:hypothetical protein